MLIATATLSHPVVRAWNDLPPYVRSNPMLFEVYKAVLALQEDRDATADLDKKHLRDFAPEVERVAHQCAAQGHKDKLIGEMTNLIRRAMLMTARVLSEKRRDSEERMKLIADIASGSTTVNSLPHIVKIARGEGPVPTQEAVRLRLRMADDVRDAVETIYAVERVMKAGSEPDVSTLLHAAKTVAQALPLVWQQGADAMAAEATNAARAWQEGADAMKAERYRGGVFVTAGELNRWHEGIHALMIAAGIKTSETIGEVFRAWEKAHAANGDAGLVRSAFAPGAKGHGVRGVSNIPDCERRPVHGGYPDAPRAEGEMLDLAQPRTRTFHGGVVNLHNMPRIERRPRATTTELMAFAAERTVQWTRATLDAMQDPEDKYRDLMLYEDLETLEEAVGFLRNLQPANDGMVPDALQTVADEDELLLIEHQLTGLLEGDGAGEDHEDVRKFFTDHGISAATAARLDEAISLRRFVPANWREVIDAQNSPEEGHFYGWPLALRGLVLNNREDIVRVRSLIPFASGERARYIAQLADSFEVSTDHAQAYMARTAFGTHVATVVQDDAFYSVEWVRGTRAVNGVKLYVLPVAGRGEEQMSEPRGMAIDRNGRIAP